jgi:transcriptional regulator with XRE-family HTH domain
LHPARVVHIRYALATVEGMYTNDFNMQVAARLRAVMAERGVKQIPLSEYIGRSQSYVSDRTSGKLPLGADIIAGVAHLAGMTPRQLVMILAGEDTGAPDAPAPRPLDTGVPSRPGHESSQSRARGARGTKPRHN